MHRSQNYEFGGSALDIRHLKLTFELLSTGVYLVVHPGLF